MTKFIKRISSTANPQWKSERKRKKRLQQIRRCLKYSDNLKSERKTNWIDFSEIRWGDVFRTEDGDYCMRVSGSAEYNAVRVGTGQLVHIGGGELVSPVHNAEMVVNF